MLFMHDFLQKKKELIFFSMKYSSSIHLKICLEICKLFEVSGERTLGSANPVQGKDLEGKRAHFPELLRFY